MGVFGLWKFLDNLQVPKIIKEDNLEGKTMAIDASIWIHKNMHLHSRNISKIKMNFLKKILRILSHKITPIFVFDGNVLDIKKRVQIQREKQKNNYIEKAKKNKQNEILKRAKLDFIKNMINSQTNDNSQFDIKGDHDCQNSDESYQLSSESEKNSDCQDFVEMIHKIDFESVKFKSLPIETQYQLLSYMKSYLVLNETIGNNDNLYNISEENSLSQDFLTEYSQIQLKKSLTQSKIRKKMLQIEQQISMSRLKDIEFSLNSSSNVKIDSYRVASKDCMHSLIIKLVKEDQSNHKPEFENDELSYSESDDSFYQNDSLMDENAKFSNHFVKSNISQNADEINGSDSAAVDDLSKSSRSSSSDSFITVVEDLDLNKSENVKNITDNDLKIPIEKIPDDLILKKGQNKTFDDETISNSKMFKLNDSLPKQNLEEEKDINEIKLKLSEDLLEVKKDLDLHKDKDAQIQTRIGFEFSTIKMILLEVLEIFGITVIDSPFEAESQCAALENSKLCDGVISDDSDTFLFGSKFIVRNFFSSQKPIQLYDSKKLNEIFGLNFRQKLILFSSLTGSDYFSGVRGIGPKKSSEIINDLISIDIEINDKNAVDILLNAKSVSKNEKLIELIKSNKDKIEASGSWNSYLFPIVQNFNSKFSTSLKYLDRKSELVKYIDELQISNQEKTTAILIFDSLATSNHEKQNKITKYTSRLQ